MAKKQEQKQVAAPAKDATKTHSQRGKYVYKPITSVIVDCSCGGKFVKTRRGQTTCVRCIQESE